MQPKDGDIVVLEILAISGRNLPNKDFFKKQDPFLTFQINSQTHRTKVDKNGGTRPEWNNRIRFERLKAPVETIMKVKCFDDEWKRKEQFIGECALDLGPVYQAGECDGWFKLYDRGIPAGEVYLELTFFTKDGLAKKYAQQGESIPIVPHGTAIPTKPLIGPQPLANPSSTNSTIQNKPVALEAENKPPITTTLNNNSNSVAPTATEVKFSCPVSDKNESTENPSQILTQAQITPSATLALNTNPAQIKPAQSNSLSVNTGLATTNSIEELTNAMQHTHISNQKPNTLPNEQIHISQNELVTSPSAISPNETIMSYNSIGKPVQNNDPTVQPQISADIPPQTQPHLVSTLNELALDSVTLNPEKQYQKQSTEHHLKMLSEVNDPSVNNANLSSKSNEALGSPQPLSSQTQQKEQEEPPKPLTGLQKQLYDKIEARKKKQAEAQMQLDVMLNASKMELSNEIAESKPPTTIEPNKENTSIHQTLQPTDSNSEAPLELKHSDPPISSYSNGSFGTQTSSASLPSTKLPDSISSNPNPPTPATNSVSNKPGDPIADVDPELYARILKEAEAKYQAQIEALKQSVSMSRPSSISSSDMKQMDCNDTQTVQLDVGHGSQTQAQHSLAQAHQPLSIQTTQQTLNASSVPQDSIQTQNHSIHQTQTPQKTDQTHNKTHEAQGPTDSASSQYHSTQNTYIPQKTPEKPIDEMLNNRPNYYSEQDINAKPIYSNHASESAHNLSHMSNHTQQSIATSVPVAPGTILASNLVQTPGSNNSYVQNNKVNSEVSQDVANKPNSNQSYDSNYVHSKPQDIYQAPQSNTYHANQAQQINATPQAYGSVGSLSHNSSINSHLNYNDLTPNQAYQLSLQPNNNKPVINSNNPTGNLPNQHNNEPNYHGSTVVNQDLPISINTSVEPVKNNLSSQTQQSTLSQYVTTSPTHHYIMSPTHDPNLSHMSYGNNGNNSHHHSRPNSIYSPYQNPNHSNSVHSIGSTSNYSTYDSTISNNYGLPQPIMNSTNDAPLGFNPLHYQPPPSLAYPPQKHHFNQPNNSNQFTPYFPNQMSSPPQSSNFAFPQPSIPDNITPPPLPSKPMNMPTTYANNQPPPLPSRPFYEPNQPPQFNPNNPPFNPQNQLNYDGFSFPQANNMNMPPLPSRLNDNYNQGNPQFNHFKPFPPPEEKKKKKKNMLQKLMDL